MRKNGKFVRIVCIVLVALLLASTCAASLGSCSVPEARVLDSSVGVVDAGVSDSDAA